MTAFFSAPIARFLADNDHETVSTSVGVVVVVLATALLIEKVLVVAIDPGARDELWNSWMNLLIFPLLICLGLILILRFLALLH